MDGWSARALPGLSFHFVPLACAARAVLFLNFFVIERLEGGGTRGSQAKVVRGSPPRVCRCACVCARARRPA